MQVVVGQMKPTPAGRRLPVFACVERSSKRTRPVSTLSLTVAMHSEQLMDWLRTVRTAYDIPLSSSITLTVFIPPPVFPTWLLTGYTYG